MSIGPSRLSAVGSWLVVGAHSQFPSHSISNIFHYTAHYHRYDIADDLGFHDSDIGGCRAPIVVATI